MQDGTPQRAAVPAAATRHRLASAALWRWMWLGVNAADTSATGRKTVQTNVGAMILLLTMAGYLALFALAFESAVVWPVVWQAALACLSPLVWYLNARRKLYAARCLLTLLAVGGVWLVIVLGQGTVMSAHLYFLWFSLVTATIFDAREWRTSVGLSTACVALFVYFACVGATPLPQMDAVGPAARQWAERGVLLMGTLTVLVMLLLTEISAAQAEGRLRRQAHTDPLTQLPNRRHFMQRFADERQRTLREGQPMCVAAIDLDQFKAVNDSLGHEAGDDALRHVARLLRRHARPYDTLARLGGEEFGWLLPGANPAAAMQAAERMRDLLAQSPWLYRGQTRVVTASIGVAECNADTDGGGALACADKAMYAAKRAGRNQVRLADPQ